MKKRKLGEGYKEYSLDNGVKFLAKNDKDAEKYRNKIKERLDSLRKITKNVG